MIVQLGRQKLPGELLHQKFYTLTLELGINVCGVEAGMWEILHDSQHYRNAAAAEDEVSRLTYRYLQKMVYLGLDQFDLEKHVYPELLALLDFVYKSLWPDYVQHFKSEERGQESDPSLPIYYFIDELAKVLCRIVILLHYFNRSAQPTQVLEGVTLVAVNVLRRVEASESRYYHDGNAPPELQDILVRFVTSYV